MLQNILNGFYKFEVTKMTEFEDNNQIENLRMVEINDTINENEFLVTDQDGNVQIFDYEKKSKVSHKVGKCFLVYSLGQNIMCYNLQETHEEFGHFIVLEGKKLQIMAIVDNFLSHITEIDVEDFSEKSTCETTLNNQRPKIIALNTVYFSDGQLLYSRRRIFKFDEYKKEEKSMESSLFISFLKNMEIRSVSCLNRFILVSENGKKHFCFILSGFSSTVLLMSFAEDLENLNFLFIFIANQIRNENFKLANFLLNTPILAPCNIRISIKEKLLCVSSIKNPPRIDFNYNFVLKILSCILNERQTIFFSENSTKCFQTIMFFYHIIKPFRYRFFISSRIPKKIETILNSPFPFLLGTNDRNIRYTNPECLFIDLDEYEVYNPRKDILPFEKQLRQKFRKRAKTDIYSSYQIIFREYFDILKNNLDIARENYILENISDRKKLKVLILKPEVIKKKIEHLEKTFIENFIHTRIFKDYMSNTQSDIILDYTVNYMKNDSLFDICKTNLKPAKIKKNSKFLYALFVHLNSDIEIVSYLKNNLFEEDVFYSILPEIFERLSQIGNYDDIFDILENMKEKNIKLTPEIFSNICFFDQRKIEVTEIIDLRGVRITVFEVCMCCGVVLSDQIMKDKILERNFPINKSGKPCSTAFNALFIETDLDDEALFFKIYDPEDLYLYIKRNKTRKIETLEKNIFWNVITYFLVYNLPFNYVEPLDDSCDLIIEEKESTRHLNLLRLPDLYFKD